MKYREGQILIYKKDSKSIPVLREYFIKGNTYKILRAKNSYISVMCEKNIMFSFQLDSISNYFHIKFNLNKKIRTI